jgi:hypothetical protein
VHESETRVVVTLFTVNFFSFGETLKIQFQSIMYQSVPHSLLVFGTDVLCDICSLSLSLSLSLFSSTYCL